MIEVLRNGPDSIEAAWATFAETVCSLTAKNQIRPLLLTEQLDAERHVAARQRWVELG